MRTSTGPARAGDTATVAFTPQPTIPYACLLPGTGEPLLIVSVTATDLVALGPGFARWDPDGATFVHRHPTAQLRLHRNMAYLFVDRWVYAPFTVSPQWCSYPAVAVALLSPVEPGRKDQPWEQFLTAIDEGTVLLADVAVTVDDR